MTSKQSDTPIDDFIRAIDEQGLTVETPTDGLVETLSADVTRLMDSWGFRGFTETLLSSAPLVSVEREAEFPVSYPWHFTGVYDGFPNEEGKVTRTLGGRTPNGQTVEVTGVTLVQRTPEGAQLKVYVDWPPLLAQIGLMVSTRPVIAVEEGHSN